MVSMERQIYLRTVWVARNRDDITTLAAGEALWTVELLYDFSLLLVHPDYQNREFPEDFTAHGWRDIAPEHRLQFLTMERRNPLFLLAAIPAVVAAAPAVAAGAGTVWALTQTVEKIANFRLNREKLKWETRLAQLDYEAALARRHAEPAARQLREQIDEGNVKPVDGELSEELPAA